MKQAGQTLLFFGIGTILLNLIGYEFAILMWIDTWGTEIGWALRGALVVAGLALFFVGSRTPDSEEPA